MPTPTIFGFDAGSAAAIASATFALVSLGFALWSGSSARRSSKSAASSYRLNAAKEWADRVGGIEYEHTLAEYACKDLQHLVSAKYLLGGGLNSSAHQEIEADIKKLRADSQSIKNRYQMTVVPEIVLGASSGEKFASLVAELEFDRSRIRALRTRLESLRDVFSAK